MLKRSKDNESSTEDSENDEQNIDQELMINTAIVDANAAADQEVISNMNDEKDSFTSEI